MITAIIIFVIGVAFLLFNESKGPTCDIIGFILVIGAFIYVTYHASPVKIDLPEEYMAITPKDALKGHYNAEGVLILEFKQSNTNK